MDNNQMLFRWIQVYYLPWFSLPIENSIRIAEQPAMKMADQDDWFLHSSKTPGKLIGSVGRAIEIPKVFHLVGIQPGFNMGKMTPIDLVPGQESPHEFENSRAISLPGPITDLNTKPSVMVSPDTNHR